uniref:Agouti domain-containing protein n=1 Tax=Oreochromis aureus TaxID=47969 RepID=A0AAZ1XTT7_OREAU
QTLTPRGDPGPHYLRADSCSIYRLSNIYYFWSQAKNRRLFARQKISPPRQSVNPKHKSNLVTPARRCGRLMESCSPHMLCCDPCASCRCRLFNTICHCWRMNPLCLKRT